MNFDSSPVQNDHQVLSVRSNKQGCNQLFGFNNVKRNNSTHLDSQNLQPDSTFGSRLGSIRGLADRIKRFYSMQFDDQVRKGAVTPWNWCATSGHISSQMRLKHIVSHILVHAFVMFNWSTTIFRPMMVSLFLKLGSKRWTGGVILIIRCLL